MPRTPRPQPTCKQVVQVIVDQIEHLPGGYLFWHSLPAIGIKAARTVVKRWTRLLGTEFYPVSFRQAVVLAVLSDEGVPETHSRQLYLWAIKHLYSNQPAKLHQDWSYLKLAQANKKVQ